MATWVHCPGEQVAVAGDTSPQGGCDCVSPPVIARERLLLKVLATLAPHLYIYYLIYSQPPLECEILIPVLQKKRIWRLRKSGSQPES